MGYLSENNEYFKQKKDLLVGGDKCTEIWNIFQEVCSMTEDFFYYRLLSEGHMEQLTSNPRPKSVSTHSKR